MDLLEADHERMSVRLSLRRWEWDGCVVGAGVGVGAEAGPRKWEWERGVGSGSGSGPVESGVTEITLQLQHPTAGEIRERNSRQALA